MDEMMDIMMDKILGSAFHGITSSGDIARLFQEGIVGYALDAYGAVIRSVLWIFVLCMIPAVIFAVFYCFFGLRFYRFLVAFDSAICGGLIIGIILFSLLIAMESSPGMAVFGGFVGFVVGAALFGFLAWQFIFVFIVLHALGLGFFTVTQMLMTIGLPFFLAIPMGIIAGITFCVLIFTIGLHKTVIGITAVKGAVTLASFVQLISLAIFLSLTMATTVYVLSLIGFTLGGIYFQCKKLLPEALAGNNRMNAPSGGMSPVPVSYPVNARWRIVGTRGMYQGAVFDIDNSLTIGRDASRCNLIYQDNTTGVSRVQCRIYPKNGGLCIVDNSSSYGTFVNGNRITQGMEISLKENDTIVFGGENEFRVQI